MNTIGMYWITDVANEHVLTVSGGWRTVAEAAEDTDGVILLDTAHDAAVVVTLLSRAGIQARLDDARRD